MCALCAKVHCIRQQVKAWSPEECSQHLCQRTRYSAPCGAALYSLAMSA